MLAQLTGKRRPFKFAVFDFEWHPDTLAITVAGLHDGKQYRCFHNMTDFLHHVLTRSYTGTMFFAHFGGRFDIVFFLPFFELLVKQGYEVDLAFNASSVMRAEVRYGRYRWIFCDSQFLLKEPLWKIGEAIGIKKLEEIDFRTASLSLIVERNRIDCEILYTALSRFADLVHSIGGEMRFTLASTALATFRRAFLTKDLPTSRVLNNMVRPAYVASRVEVIRGAADFGYCYDVNSSFPFSMLPPLPGRFIFANREIGEMCIARLRVRVPEQFLPPLPIRYGEPRESDGICERGPIFFPWGEFEGWYSWPDIELLLEAGGQILEVIESHHFEAIPDFGDYVRTIFPIRQAETDPFWKYLLKILLNSLYGKMGERELKERIVYNPKYTTCQHSPKCKPSCIRIIRPGIYAIRENVEVPHAHLPIPIFTTARSRALLWRYAMRAIELAYMDTDSLFSKTRFDDVTGTDLGALKYEGEYFDARFLAPKAYAARGNDGEFGCDPKKCKERGAPHVHDVVKIKGFRKLTRNEFDDLERGGSVIVESFRGPKTALNKTGMREDAIVLPGVDVIEKRISFYCVLCHAYLEDGPCPEHGISYSEYRPKIRPKRAPQRGVETRAWHRSELENDW